MGLYDYLGEEQVKCFGVPTVGITPEGDSFKLFIHCMGGNLRYYPRGSAVPYKTSFYNYGKNFMVFDYRTFNYGEPICDDELRVHIIRNGRYFRTVRYDRVPSRYKIGLVLDNYGEVINIKTHNDFKEIVYNWRYSHVLYDELQEKYREEMGIPNMLRLNRFDLEKYSKEEINEMFEKHRECMDRASDEALKPFSDTWYGGTEKIDKEMNKGWPFGALYDVLEKQKISEFDKYWIARLFEKEVGNKGGSLILDLKEYLDWCTINGIKVDKVKFLTFFSKYLQDIPKCVIEEYEKSDEKKFRDKVYGNKG